MAPAAKAKAPHPKKKGPGWVQGVVFGEPFQVKRAFYGDGFLFLRTQFIPTPVGLHEANRPDACNGVQIAVPTGEDLQGKRFSVQLTDSVDPRPDINLFVVSDSGAVDGKIFQKFHSTSPYRMVLQFFRINKGLLPGYIELHLTDTTKRPTTIKGYFYAQPGTGNVITPPGLQ